jgi:hypothetical protein
LEELEFESNSFPRSARALCTFRNNLLFQKYQLTPWRGVLEKLAGSQSRYRLYFMESKGSLLPLFWDKFIIHNSLFVEEAKNVLSEFEQTFCAFIGCGYDQLFHSDNWLGY